MRRRALLRLTLLGEPTVLDAARASLRDESADVREAAVRAFGALGTSADATLLVEQFRAESDPRAVASIIDSVGILGGETSGPFLRDLILAAQIAPVASGPGAWLDGPPADFLRAPRSLGPFRTLDLPASYPPAGADVRSVGALAVRAAKTADRLESFDALVSLLGGDDLAMAEEAARSLEFITNHTFSKAGDERALAERLSEARAGYEKLALTMKRAPRDWWLLRGFGVKGHRVRALDNRGIWDLVKAVGGDDFVSYNARRILARLAGDRVDTTTWSPHDACRHYLRHFDDNRRAFLLQRPDTDVRTACWKAKGVDMDPEPTDPP
jgi:hypothetical protein